MSNTRRLVVTAIVLLAAAAAGIFGWAYRTFTTAGPLESAAAFVIPKGLGVDGIAAILLKDGVIRDAHTFSLAVELLGERRALRAGEYLFPANASIRDAIDVLLHAKPVMRHLTVAEGLTNAQVIDLLAHVDGLEGAVKESLEEGTLLPQTYNYSWGDGRDDMLARMRKAMSETLDQLWKDRAPDLQLRSEEEALTLASIVEKETAKPDERPHVAAVFLNRLRNHMRLQSDPTVVYALTDGRGALGRPLVHADLEVQSRYNTYQNDGLPPGPIANPGKAAIAAVLHPSESEDLYFVADGTGGHAFARTLPEHNKNVAKLRQIQNGESGKSD
jgi:UPF0755 protein